FAEVVPSASDVNFVGLNHTIPGGVTQTITLTTKTDSAVTFSLQYDAAWLTVTPSNGTVSASKPAKIQITVNPSYFQLNETFTEPVAILSGAAPPVYLNV